MEHNVARASENEVLIHKELEKQGDKEPEPVTGPKSNTILSLDHRAIPNTTDEVKTMELMPVLDVEEPWPQSLWEIIRNRKDKSATLQSTPIPEIVLDNEFYPSDIHSLYGDAGTEIFMDKDALARQWDKFPYEVDELSTNEKSHISDEVLAQIPAHIFIAKFRDDEGDNIKTTIMPREIWTLHRRLEVASAVRAVHLEQFFKLPPWGTYYMRAHELMSSIQYDGKVMLTDGDGSKMEVLITKEIINEALQFQPETYDLIPKTKAIDNEKAFLKVKGSKFKYSDLIYNKDRDSDESDCEDIPKEAEAASPSEYERSDEEDTSTPLKKKSQKPRSREQVLIDEAMARVEAKRKELADARAAKAAKTAKPTTVEEARKLRMEKAKALQKEKKLKSQSWSQARDSPKRPQQEEEEEMEHIQADPIPSSPMNIPLVPPSSPITLFPPASTSRTPPSPSTLDPPRSPPTPSSPQQQQPAEIPPSIQEETDQSMDRTEEEKKQTDSDKPRPVEIDLQIPLMQLEEPTHEEAYEEDRADRAYEEITNLRTALELITQERDTNIKDNENLLRDLIHLQSQLTRQEAQNHELIKNEKKMKEQLKCKNARFQRITASYNTVKNTVTALLQNQEPTSIVASTSANATANTLAAVQEELQTEKLHRQLLVSSFMSHTAQHEAKVKQLELKLAQAKADLELQKQQSEVLSKGKEAVGSLASTSQIRQAEIHLHIQLPLMPEMPEFPSTQEEEQQRPAPGALDVRE
ncbi:hypothetical protein L7F22_044331 [Adiantum nelumboides]|nr:hypothetical protein [Adiantum nelumboides]